MAELAYQVTDFAYQGDGEFSYQGSSGAVVVQEIRSGGYWPDYKTRRRTKEDVRRERIERGILPPELEIVAQQAVVQAVAASAQVSKAPGPSLLKAMEARESYENAYRQAYKTAYVAEVVAEHWKEDLRRASNRRAILLLLH